MLVIDWEGFNKAIHISHQEPLPNSVYLLVQNHFKQRPARKVWNQIHGYHPNEEVLEVDWPCHPPRSLHRQDCLALDTRRKAKEGRLKITWWRTVEKEMQQMGKTWSSISVLTMDRQKWRDHVAALHTTRRNGHELASDQQVNYNV